MDILELAQMLFLSDDDPQVMCRWDVDLIVHAAYMTYHSLDQMLVRVARRFHADPDGSSVRMADCLTVAFGYLDDDALAEVLLTTVFGGTK